MKNTTVSILMILLLFSCENSKNYPIKDEDHLGRCVYVDYQKCLHTNKNCIKIRMNYQVQFVDTSYVSCDNYTSMCSRCVSDNDALRIKELVMSHSNKDSTTLNIKELDIN